MGQKESWEKAYLEFESQEEEIHKFLNRFKFFGINEWSKDLKIVDLFCGRGSGLLALEKIGFSNLIGIDLSQNLLSHFPGKAQTIEADCRTLPFENETIDVFTVQGGLHHLEEIPSDLERVLTEVHRCLKPNGLFLVVEPWSTPFLQFVHFATRMRLLTQFWPKLDALKRMIDGEQKTYENWLSQPNDILKQLSQKFIKKQQTIRFGKIFFLGVKK